jgi:glycosyltransferase involved in cell wall biosynthesis
VAHRSNLGAHASFNEGIDWASSKYFMVLCADDLLAPGSLARAMSIMELHPEVAFAYGRAAMLRPGDVMPVIDPDSENTSWQIVAGEAVLERFCRDGTSHVGGPSTVLVRTSVQKRAGYYREELPHSDDFEMWMRLASLGPAAKTDAPLAILRFHETSRSAVASRAGTSDRWPAWPWHDEAAFESFFKHEGASVTETARLRRLARRSVVERAYWAAIAHLCRGELNASRELFRFALSRRPMTAVLPPFGYLFRRDDAFRRIISVAAEMLPMPLMRTGLARTSR